MDDISQDMSEPYWPDRSNIIAHDADWQFPAITEQHAFQRALQLFPEIPNAIYVAFPWATLIDKLNTNAVDKRVLLSSLRQLPVPRTPGLRVFTVCQHILLRKFEYLFAETGITDVFWPHLTEGENDTKAEPAFTLHPFPLYPVQFPRLEDRNFDRERKYLYSFIGARANQWYLARTRDWIIDQLGGDQRALVVARDKWHYNRTVYDFQTHKRLDADPTVENEARAREFKDVLRDSLFSLCPSGTGPNSIRLWESIAVGAIPVVLADGLRLPGPAELWQQAAVFCEETPQAVSELPERLAAIAADAGRVASMRQALRQLWHVYGTEHFITDVVERAMEAAPQERVANNKVPADLTAVSLAAERIADAETVSAEDAQFLLTRTNSLLLRTPQRWPEAVAHISGLDEACRKARSAYPALASARRNADLARRNLPARSAAPGPARSAGDKGRIRVCLFGRHSNRTPLSYEAYQHHFEQHVSFVDSPREADVCVSGFEIDFTGAQDALRQARRDNPDLRLLVLSEEPLWDTVWTRDDRAETGKLESPGLPPLSYRIVNHQNSDVFDFSAIPYFITTRNSFIARYAAAFSRNGALGPDEVLERWSRMKVRSAFYAEKREDPRYDFRREEGDVYGLSVFRTRLASSVRREPCIRAGKGWDTDGPRQAICDWHLDKLARLDRQCLLVSAIENTHVKSYITEKLFDAYAVLGVPLYFASADHDVTRLVEAGSFLNLFPMEGAQAARRVDEFEPDRAFAEAYVRTQKRLGGLFGDHRLLEQERQRVASGVLRVLEETVMLRTLAS